MAVKWNVRKGFLDLEENKWNESQNNAIERILKWIFAVNVRLCQCQCMRLCAHCELLFFSLLLCITKLAALSSWNNALMFTFCAHDLSSAKLAYDIQCSRLCIIQLRWIKSLLCRSVFFSLRYCFFWFVFCCRCQDETAITIFFCRTHFLMAWT